MSSLPPLSHVLPLFLSFSSSSSSSSFSLYLLHYFKIPLLAIPFSSKLPRSLSLFLSPFFLRFYIVFVFFPRPIAFLGERERERERDFFFIPDLKYRICGIDSLKINPRFRIKKKRRCVKIDRKPYRKLNFNSDLIYLYSRARNSTG